MANLLDDQFQLPEAATIPRPATQMGKQIAIVFVHDTFTFEVWLAGNNKQVQSKYWKLFTESNWNKYRIPSTTNGVDSIIEYILVDNPDFSDLETLTKQIERGTLNFITDVENYLSTHKTDSN